jgi:hypothetical protein
MDSDNWIPLGWIPIIDETKSRRPKQGYQGGPVRNNRVCFMTAGEISFPIFVNNLLDFV